MNWEPEEWGKESRDPNIVGRRIEFTEIVQKCPESGSGVHDWILLATRIAAQAEISYADAYAQVLGGISREEQPNEIYNAFMGAVDATKNGGFGKTHSRPKFKPFDPALAEHLLQEWEQVCVDHEAYPTRKLAEFKCESPVIPSLRRRGKKVLKYLFGGDPLICAGVNQYDFDTRPLSKFEDLKKRMFLTPSPMSALKGLKASSKNKAKEELTSEDYSAHTKDNTGEREYLIVEFDTGETLDQQARKISYLRKFLPLGAIIHSGNKSLHSWFSVRNADDEFVQDFFNLACAIGADPKMWEKQQFTRMPCVIRQDTGNEQEVIYLAKVGHQGFCPFTDHIELSLPVFKTEENERSA
jgi:hypothetical protein